jgi:predicted MPP superfamily phosphohydrolase
VSDIHLTREPGSDSDFIIGSLLDALKRDAKCKPLDIIFVTGDLAFSGAAEEYGNVETFVSSLTSVTGVDPSNVFVVPGNHDVDRNRVQWLCRDLACQEDIDRYFRPSAGLPHILEGLGGFLEWHDAYFTGRAAFATGSSCQTLHTTIRNIDVDILVMNTSIFCRGDDDHGKLVVGRSCLEPAVKELRPSALRIAIGHHPFDWLHEADRPFIRSRLRSSVHMYLHGHTHDPDASATFSVDGQLMVIGTGAVYQTEKYLNSFWVVEWDGGEIRLLPYRYSSTPRPIWSLDTSIASESDAYAVCMPLEITMGTELTDTVGTAVAAASAAFSPDTLLSTPKGEPLYVEPRLGRVPFNDPTIPDLAGRSVPVSEIVESSDSYIIESKAEYGGTTLAMRICHDIEQTGKAVKLLSAREIPNYGVKLAEEIAITPSGGTIILDKFDISDHRRLLKYIKESDLYSRYILITAPTNSFKRSSETQVSEINDFKTIFHWPLSRGDVRQVACKIFGDVSDDIENAIVDKVYIDLLSLKIPLTPGNVIMYLRVLLREENFVPANRVDIIFRYVAELLRRSTDIYQDSFGYKSKIDIVSAFSYELFNGNASDFSRDDWTRFCNRYSDETLLEFDAKELLDECERVKILIRFGNRFYFRYKSYFGLFVGKHISSRASRVQQFVNSDGASRLTGLVEVVSALSADNTELVESLVAKLKRLVEDFRAEFVPKELEPYRELPWGKDEDKDDELWGTVKQRLMEGPKSPEEIDEAKTNIVSEIQAENQSVRYTEMIALESSVFRVNSNLTIALKNSESISGALKIDAAKLVQDVELIALQVGFLLAPTIATSYFVHWGGIAFVNPHATEEADSASVGRVLALLPGAIIDKVGESLASRRLSAVFHRLVDERDPTGFEFVTNFSALVRAKGAGWEGAARKALLKVDRNSFYLRVMLGVLLNEYQLEVNTISDREALKTLISIVHSKRQGKTNAPGSQLIKRVRKLVAKKLDDGVGHTSSEG